MFFIVGWKRLEVNKMLAFLAVTEATFPSILRRSFAPRSALRPARVTERCDSGILGCSPSEEPAAHLCNVAFVFFLGDAEARLTTARRRWRSLTLSRTAAAKSELGKGTQGARRPWARFYD
jgi:hypothetical protein